ncbi:MAG: ABC transporter ATP-binding protein [Candidatus Accumulibacter sp.]|jgi:branched-chain amino acid transport system ATP-binding protein|nr:ABC transporter ATP-binding protein [Accumulibacter sp.]
MLSLQNIAIRYNNVPAVHDVSLEVGEGEIVALVGGNGNGKSSTLRAIAGLNPLAGGKIVFDGQDVSAVPAHRRTRLGLSLVPEGRRLFPRLSVEKNLRLGAFTRGDAVEIEQSLDYAFELFPILKERRRQIAGTLSGGEQQMLAIGRGLMGKPRLLMLDEPSWGIAPKLVTRILDTIQQINANGLTILLVEQNVKRALEIARRSYVLQTGRIVLSGSGEELLGNPDIQKAYLGI